MTGWRSRVARIAATAVTAAGLVVLADAGLTLVWQEPVSAAYGWLGQRGAKEDFAELQRSYREAQSEQPEQARGSSSRRLARSARRLRGRAEQGQGIGRLRIPEIGLDTVIVHGTDTSTLQRGPGHYPSTALPGEGRTVAVAGHRTTYQAPFRQINELERSDQVLVEMPYGRLSYAVERTRIVEPTQVEVVADRGREQLVLTACHPLYSAEQRIVVVARLLGPDGRPAGDGRTS